MSGQRILRWLTFDRIREREIVRANDLAVQRSYRIGTVVETDEGRYRVTRHKWYRTSPWATCVVYGIRR